MFKADEIRESLAGAWQVMKGDPDGLDRMDNSVEGFWRSFGAFFLILPAYCLVVASIRLGVVESGQICEPLTAAQSVLILLSWTVDWFCFPLVMAFAVRPLGLAAGYVPFIVVRNWAAVIMMALFTIPTLLHLAGIMPSEFKALMHVMLVGVSGYFAFRICRLALDAEAGLAIAIVVSDFMLSMMIASLFPAPY